MSLEFVTNGPAETEAIGYEIGQLAAPGLLIAMQGDLGAGKTLMTKGIARGLGVPRPEYVTSPTFTIHKLYQGRLTLNHLDFYRLGDEGEAEELGIEEALAGPGVCVVEWPDSFFSFLGPDRLDIRFEVSQGDRRTLTIDWNGEPAASIGKRLAQLHGERED